MPWDDEQKRAFVEQQFDAQDAHYRSARPEASYDVILVEARPRAGSSSIAREPEMHVVDIALLPSARGGRDRRRAAPAPARRGRRGGPRREHLRRAPEPGAVALREARVPGGGTRRRLRIDAKKTLQSIAVVVEDGLTDRSGSAHGRAVPRRSPDHELQLRPEGVDAVPRPADAHRSEPGALLAARHHVRRRRAGHVRAAELVGPRPDPPRQRAHPG